MVMRHHRILSLLPGRIRFCLYLISLNALIVLSCYGPNSKQIRFTSQWKYLHLLKKLLLYRLVYFRTPFVAHFIKLFERKFYMTILLFVCLFICYYPKHYRMYFSFTRTTLRFVSGFYSFFRCQELVSDWFSALRNSSQDLVVYFEKWAGKFEF